MARTMDCRSSRDELIDRAARRTAWAGSALAGAAADLRNAGVGREDLTGLTEVVRDQADVLARLADDIDNRKGGNAPKIGVARPPSVARKLRLPYRPRPGSAR